MLLFKYLFMEEQPTILDTIWARKVPFLVVFFLVFTLSYAVLFAIDFLPEPVSAVAEESSDEADSTEDSEDAPGEAPLPAEPTPEHGNESLSDEAFSPILPESITIEALNRTVPVLNPVSRSIADLDAALLKGVVRHPDSAALNQDGTVFLLGHSSYLPVVNNANYQAFNGIQNLKWGDIIRVRSADQEYVYQVERVYEARAEEVTVPIAGTGPRLTLATCDSFGSINDRYIVEAKLVETVARGDGESAV